MLNRALEADVSRRLRMESAVERGELLFQRLLEKLPAGAYTCDAAGLITYYNQHAVRLWGRTPRLNDPVDRFCGSFKLYAIDGSPIAHDECWMALALRMQREYNGHEIIIERPDGERLTALAHANPIHDESGKLLGAVNVLVDISDRKRMEDALREADHAKSEFLATMSHEIRTPINAVIGYADLLELEVAGPLTEGQRAHLARIRAASRHLLSLVTDVLDLSKVEAGQMVLRRESRRASDAAESALAVIQPLAAAKGIVVSNRCAADPSLVYDGDEDRVRQMLINLLSNAIKFSMPGAVVEIACDAVEPTPLGSGAGVRRERWVCFRVRDSGIGIAPEQLERIFEPFVQVETAHTRTRGGTGLGLTITRRLARLMGGDLTVESVVGAGSVFTLRLPAAEAKPAARGALAPDVAPQQASAPAHLFAAAGGTLLDNVQEIVRRYVERLRVQHPGSGARTLSNAQLANHAGTLLSDIAVTLLALEDGDGTSATFASGSEIQRVCALEHGRQRAHLGWTEADLAHEYDVLWQEVARVVGDPAPESPTETEIVRGAIRTRIEQARTYGVRALESARLNG